MLHHLDLAMTDASEAGQTANLARLEATRGGILDDRTLLEGAIARAEISGDKLAMAYCAQRYGDVLGGHGQFEASLEHFARAVEIHGAQDDLLHQSLVMARGGRCYSARAGKLVQSLDFAGQVRENADALNNAELRAWCAMNAEPYYYMGLWDQAVVAAQDALPVAWEIGEWPVIIFSSAWLALAYSKLGQADNAQRVLDRLFNEMPARIVRSQSMALPYAQIARAQIYLTAGNYSEALDTVHQALDAAVRRPFVSKKSPPIASWGRSTKPWATGPRPRLPSGAAWRSSTTYRCPPELAQTLLAYGRFRRGDNAQEDRPLLERALRLFEEMKATGWIAETRIALAAASPASRGRPDAKIEVQGAVFICPVERGFVCGRLTRRRP